MRDRINITQLDKSVRDRINLTQLDKPVRERINLSLGKLATDRKDGFDETNFDNKTGIRFTKIQRQFNARSKEFEVQPVAPITVPKIEPLVINTNIEPQNQAIDDVRIVVSTDSVDDLQWDSFNKTKFGAKSSKQFDARNKTKIISPANNSNIDFDLNLKDRIVSEVINISVSSLDNKNILIDTKSEMRTNSNFSNANVMLKDMKDDIPWDQFNKTKFSPKSALQFDSKNKESFSNISKVNIDSKNTSNIVFGENLKEKIVSEVKYIKSNISMDSEDDIPWDQLNKNTSTQTTNNIQNNINSVFPNKFKHYIKHSVCE